MWVRGLTIWLGAALIGSIVGTTGLQLISRGGWAEDEIRLLIRIGLITLFFTVPGSAFLFLSYGCLARFRAGENFRYPILVLWGGLAGAFITSFMHSPALGAGYGIATALTWVALLRSTNFDQKV